MKSLTAVCQTGAAATMPAINASGRITRHPQHRGDGENAEMKMYLSKLKDLVPFMPKNRKLSKLEIIQHVIDYICDLQTELETHPDVNNFDAANALNNYASAAAAAVAEAQHDNEQNSSPLNAILSQRLLAEQEHQQHRNHQQQQHNNVSSPATPVRQPLVDRQTPNTILPNPPAAAQATTIITTTQQHQQLSTLNNAAAPTVTSSTQQQTASSATTEKESNSRLSQAVSSSSVSSSPSTLH